MDKLPDLYGVTSEIRTALDSDDPEALDRLEELVPALEERAPAVVRWINLVGDTIDLLKAREERIRDARKQLETSLEEKQRYIVDAMLRADATRIIDNRTGTEIALKKNPPKVVVDDETVIPEAFWRQPEPPPPALDKKALAAALKEYGSVPGCHAEQGWTLKIRG